MRGDKDLTPREQALLAGRHYEPTAQEIEQGKRLVKAYGIKTQQLTDCNICHR